MAVSPPDTVAPSKMAEPMTHQTATRRPAAIASATWLPLMGCLAAALGSMSALAQTPAPVATPYFATYGNGPTYGTSVVGAYNPYTQAGPGNSQGRAYGATPVAPYPPNYPPSTAQAPAGPRGTGVPAPAPARATTPPSSGPYPQAGVVGAYNPWRGQYSGGYQPGATPLPAYFAPYGSYDDADAGTNLPSPPPGPIRSRLLSVPEGPPAVVTRPTPYVTIPTTPGRSTARQPTRDTAVAAVAPIPRATPAPSAAPRVAAVATPARPPEQVVAANPPARPAPEPAAVPAPAAPAKPAVVAAKPAEAPAATARVVAPSPTRPASPSRDPQLASAPAATDTPTAPARPAATPGPVVVASPPSGMTEQIAFDAESPVLSDGARATLDRLANQLRGGTSSISVKNYGGAAGEATSDNNRRLSLRRAIAVRSHLIEKGIAKDRILVEPLAATANGGARDRVDIVSRTL